ncbi:phage tail sheath subtilisin-like domain-containing protein [Paucibacter sp. O1-1]|uniref:phage tail sheath family protein n=1 Tax=Paucibacter sp. M5-1 TaxID=3015998 RepID=UPI0010F4BFE7|nr:phage tail sheath C-terminal domain-containing protein [Paucibacter sp. M5-1]MCU7372585.1 phage tail sheath subtilisin-like domain-containing protein [Paucibacter sp. O1-1]MCZ7882874.1 phage tail sheath subtilisin-like domain-containing protein [Paucibacter sp. M5-1]MDA3827579.1 phage tail sheath subtilisin-like domain-containing protein [Paucibacter sp. O1-1]
MGVMKTPGVYIVEKNAFPNSVVEVATAVPAFIGHTQIADNRNKPLAMKPWRISSMAEYHQYYGFGPVPRFNIVENTDPSALDDFKAGGKGYVLQQPAGKDGGSYFLYSALRHFFQNGGGPCYIVSVGTYEQDLDLDKFKAGIDELLKEQEPTMLVIPEAVRLKEESACIDLQQAMLAHCGDKMRNRVAILDIWGGDKPRSDPGGDPVARFRNDLGINFLDFAAAYYPWLNTTVVGDKDLSYENILSIDVLKTLLRQDLALPDTLPDNAPAKLKEHAQAVDDISKDWAADPRQLSEDAILTHKTLLNKTLAATSALFNTIIAEARSKLNLLPPSAAMAGVYTMVDNTRGVWKAPANVSLAGVISPTVSVSAVDQEELNVTTQGKSINAIRAFIGEGVLVWGARTLDGNSLDWRYINVRRTMIMLEESCRLAAKALVFEPNVANTWVTIKSMIQNFLTSIWKRGGLAGASPEDAFSVHVGLGETMTPDDILEGILRVTVLVAMVRPAEFIEITFQQQMQKS